MHANRSGRRPAVLLVLGEGGGAEAVADHLDRTGFAVTRLPFGAPPPDTAAMVGTIDALVVDLARRDLDGMAFAEAVFDDGPAEALPAVVLLADPSDTVARIVALEIGVDDVLPRSTAPREIAARLRALLGRLGRPVGRGRVIRLGRVGIDLDLQRVIAPDGEENALGPAEFALLKCFLDEPDRVFTRDDLIERAPATDEDVLDRAIDRRIARLRRKIELSGEILIEPVRGQGYRLTLGALGSLSD